MATKIVTRYQCGSCGHIFNTERGARVCEAIDYGLSDTEYDEWERLTENADKAAKSAYCTKNEDTEAAWGRAVKDLLAFKESHNLSSYSFR